MTSYTVRDNLSRGGRLDPPIVIMCLKKCSVHLPVGQSYKDLSSAEVPSFQIILDCVKVTKN